MLDRLRALLRKAPAAIPGVAAWRCAPNAHFEFSAHPEFHGLWRKFVAHNHASSGDLGRLWALMLNVKQIVAEGVPGDFAEVGVWRGNTAAVLAHYAQAAGRTAFLFDTFKGFDERDLVGPDAKTLARFQDTSLDIVAKVIGDAFGACRCVVGRFPETVKPEHSERAYAAVSLDCDLYEPIKAGLEFFYPRLSRGGALFVHDYSSGHWEGVRGAVDEFCRRTGERVILLPDAGGTAIVRKNAN